MHVCAATPLWRAGHSICLTNAQIPERQPHSPVYLAWTLHPETSETTVTRYKGMPAWIDKIPRGKAIMETAEDVDAAAIDEHGRYVAAAKR